MANLALVVVCFLLGVAARRWSGLPAETPKVLNAWIFFVALPAMVLRVVHSVPLGGALVLAAGGLWLVFVVGAGLALLAVRLRLLTREVAGALALTAGLANTSFVGLPLLEALGGPEALGPAVVVDQLGSFLLLPVLAMPLAAHLSGRGQSAGAMVRRLLTFPPFLALLLALALRPVAFPTLLDDALGRLGDMLSPLALASVGWQLEPRALVGNGARVAAGLTFKLVIAPAMVLGVVLLFGRSLGVVERVAVAQAAMAPMVTGAALATDYELAPQLAAAMVALGVTLSLVTVPVWWALTAL